MAAPYSPLNPVVPGALWYAVRVKPQHERSVALGLDARGLIQFLPFHREIHRWSDRRKVVAVPLFPGYVFCRFHYAERLRVLQTAGVRYIVGVGGKATPIPEEEMSAIGRIVQSQRPAEPTAFLEVGQLVLITEGPLMGLQGFLQQHRNQRRLVVGVSLLHRSVAVELDSDWVEPVLAQPFGPTKDAGVRSSKIISDGLAS